MLRERIEAKALRVTRSVDDPALTVRADRDKILQVFLNLLGNAVKFSHERGSIEIVARRGKPGFALVQVSDHGVGIAKEDLEKIFDRFYQTDASRDRQGKGRESAWRSCGTSCACTGAWSTRRASRAKAR